MLQEEDFHFCLLISQQGLCGLPSHLSFSFPNPNILYKKGASDKEPPIRRPNPSYTGLKMGKLSHCLSLHHLPEQREKTLFQRLQQPGPVSQRGKYHSSMFPFHSGYKNTASLHLLLQFSNQAKHRHVKIELPPKVREETQMAISYTHMYICMYSNEPTQRQMSVFPCLCAY